MFKYGGLDVESIKWLNSAVVIILVFVPISWKQELIFLNSETLINILYICVQYKINCRLWSPKFLFGEEFFGWYFSGNTLPIFSKGRGLSVVPNTAGGAKGRLLTVATGLSKPLMASCLHWGDKGTSEALRSPWKTTSRDRGKEGYLEVTKHAEGQPICGDSHSHSVFMWPRSFPGGSDRKESACWCRRHRFHPWPGEIPHLAEQLSLSTTAMETVLSPRAQSLCPQQVRPHSEKRVHHS